MSDTTPGLFDVATDRQIGRYVIGPVMAFMGDPKEYPQTIRDGLNSLAAECFEEMQRQNSAENRRRGLADAFAKLRADLPIIHTDGKST